MRANIGCMGVVASSSCLRATSGKKRRVIRVSPVRIYVIAERMGVTTCCIGRFPAVVKRRGVFRPQIGTGCSGAVGVRFNAVRLIAEYRAANIAPFNNQPPQVGNYPGWVGYCQLWIRRFIERLPLHQGVTGRDIVRRPGDGRASGVQFR